ncbi:hypothetical protein [Enterococcus nangangensis]|uniref:hypothetical protein n=1 Tax=Enterococcus nangangensis TaxID=2559926 RepID=UPI0010F7B5F5|nr:hypothetical protein [Enterococcus nangangensis]
MSIRTKFNKIVSNFVIVFVVAMGADVLMLRLMDWLPQGDFAWMLLDKFIKFGFILWFVAYLTARREGRPIVLDKYIFGSLLIFSVMDTGVNFIQRLHFSSDIHLFLIGLRFVLFLVLLFVFYKIYRRKLQQ